MQATDDRGRRQAAVDPREIFNKITIGCRLSQSFPDHQRLNVRPGSAALGRNRSTSALDQSWKGCDNELYEIEFRTGEFADDFSLNFPKMEHEFADQSSDGDFANDFSLNFPKMEHKFADQSSGGEFPAVMIGGIADSGAVEQPSLEQWILDLPQQALQHMVAAGAVQHLPDRIAPTITRDTEGSQTVFGQDGVHDIVVFDVANLGSEMDSLVNWDPGEDMLAIVNFTDDDIVGVTVRIPSGASLLNIDGTDVAALGFMRPDDVFSMVATFNNDPFAFI